MQRGSQAVVFRTGNDQDQVHASGTIQTDEVQIASEHGGRITQVHVVPGMHVRSGAPLAALDARALEDKLAEAEAAVSSAQADLDTLQAGARAQEIEAAKAAVLRAQIDTFVLRSPMEDTVPSQALCRGELATPAAIILTIADLDQVTLTVYVPVNQVRHVHLDQRVQVAVDSYPGATFAGRVARIGDQPEFTPRNIATQKERQNTFYAVEIRLPMRPLCHLP